MSAMPSVTHEVKLMLGQPVEEQAASTVKFGAKDVMDLTWKNALDAYSCTECGRCTEQCPANQTGRALSPRKIMMDTRDRLEEVGGILKVNKGVFVEDGKSLFDRISAEELRACTSCQACVEACPMELVAFEYYFRDASFSNYGIIGCAWCVECDVLECGNKPKSVEI